jgi:diamine N-acetyltransferase
MFSIRHATATDINLIRELTYKVWPQTYASIISPEQIEYMLEMMYSPASLAKQMAGGAQFIIVYEKEIPVGFASYQQVKPAMYKLHKLYVLPSQQGKGTGRYIIDYLCNEIKENGGLILQLQVNRRNKARDFYGKIGFSVIEEFDFEIGNGYVMDDYVMEKKL